MALPMALAKSRFCTGWGEVTTYPGPVANRAVAAYIDQIGAWLKGENPANIEALWHKTFRAMTYVGTRGATTAAISAIDIALWDIRGKLLGLPIYQLLGGPVRAGDAAQGGKPGDPAPNLRWRAAAAPRLQPHSGYGTRGGPRRLTEAWVAVRQSGKRHLTP